MGRGRTDSAPVLFRREAGGTGADTGDDVPMRPLWLSRVVRDAGCVSVDAISRRRFLQAAVCTAAGTTLAGRSGLMTQGRQGDREVLREFPYGAVKLTGGPLKQHFDRIHAHYLALDNDRLLKVFRERAGLPAPGPDMGGWYDTNGFVPGLTLGQYISGLARLGAATGDKAAHEKVARVHHASLPSHPEHAIAARQMQGFGGVVSFEINGDLAAGSRLVDACRIPRIAPSLGGVESLIEQPALMSFFELSTEERLEVGIKDSLIRYSVGIEDAEDLIADLQQALDAV